MQDPANRTSFGELLRRYRVESNLTQMALARRAGMTAQAIGMLERGSRRVPRRDTVGRLSRALHLGPSQAAAFAAASMDAPAIPSAPEPSDEGAALATRTLPRDIATFTGREDELERLLTIVTEAALPGRPFPIGAIDGMPGVGKTAFAIHAAHLLAARFPDGQLFVDLHTHSAGQRPVSPFAALGSLLVLTGVTKARLPDDLDTRAAVWRDRVAGKRMLILLDDADGHDQVRPLLPGAPGCLVLVTSRRRLSALQGAQPLELGTLPPAQAAELFRRLIGARAEAQPEAVAELVELCGCLPLAIGLLAGRLRSHSTWTVSHLASMLRDAQDRLAEMKAENIAVATAFNMSYQDLPANLQRLFRRLSLHPGREIDAHAAAILDGSDLGWTRWQLDVLYNEHLIDEPEPGRYRFHDLIRDYARALADQDRR
ncbi:MAG TPA: helix-turn-helix domain-containing protein [Candidatus Dormibacteraeota bacterium]|nr:helix-turn-helix domain-containing protein [Candidatus Dormibacteraeota bacterium]